MDGGLRQGSDRGGVEVCAGAGGEGQRDGGKMRGVNRVRLSERERDGRRSICHHGCNGAESIQERGCVRSGARVHMHTPVMGRW